MRSARTHLGVDAGRTGLGAAVAPRNDADQRVDGLAHEQRPARVALARVDAAGLEAGAQHRRQVVHGTVTGTTLVVRHHRHYGLVQLVGQLLAAVLPIRKQ